MYKRKHRDYYEDKCEDRYIDNYKDEYRNKYRDDSFDNKKDKSKIKYCTHNARKDDCSDSEFDKNRGRSKEKGYLYDDDDRFGSEIERVHKILQMISQEKEMTIGFMLVYSENPGKILHSIHSPADVDHLIAERIEYVKRSEG